MLYSDAHTPAYPRSLTPRAEYLALTLCKPIGGVVKYTALTPPSSQPADPRHWTPPIFFSCAVNPEPLQDWSAAASLKAVRRRSERMLQAAGRRLTKTRRLEGVDDEDDDGDENDKADSHIDNNA